MQQKRDVKRAIQKLAERQGVSEEEVRNEIQRVIQVCLENQDPEIQMRWRRIPCQGSKPTPEEVILYLFDLIIKGDE